MYNDNETIDAQTIEAQTESEVPQEATQEEPLHEVQEQREVETDKAMNFRALREAKEKAERERDEAIKVLREAYSAQQRPVVEEPEYEEGFSIAPDDIVEGKHLSKVDKKIKQLEKQIQQYQKQSQEVALETRIKAQYPDFDAVVSKQNVEMLQAAHPEIAQTLITSTDLYSKSVTAYKMIKQLGIYQDPAQYQMDVTRAQKNLAKPRPVASVSPQQGEGALSKANAFAGGLTDELKAQIYKEMVAAIKNR